MKSLLLLGCTVLSFSTIAYSSFLPQTPANLVLAQTPESQSTDTSPLLQGGRQLLGLERYELESVMDITADMPGALLNTQAKIFTKVEAPNKINTQITFSSPNGLEGKTYEIVSDGSQVWIYDWATNQYSVSELKQFLQTREGFLIGALSHFYVSTRSNIGSSGILANFLAKLPEDRLIRYFQRFANIDIQNSVIREETVAGKTYKAYDLQDRNKGLQATAYVDAPKEYIERVHLSATKDGLQLATQERITNQNIPESISADKFSFSPDKDAQQLPQQISIQPF